MQISIAEPNNIEFFAPVPIKNLNEMVDLCLRKNFSPAIFTNGKRNLQNFERAYCIGLDIDNDGKRKTPEMTIEEAKLAFKDYKHLILPSRSHRKEKHGKVCDRFRVIVFLSQPISDLETFYATWFWLKEQWPAIDDACKNPDRFYFKHSAVSSVQETGLLFSPVAPKPKPATSIAVLNVAPGERGKLSKNTLEYLEKGPEVGDRNQGTVRVAKDFQQNLYPIDEAMIRIVEALHQTDTITRDFTEAEVIRTIRSAYNSDARHEPRIRQKAFDLVRLHELYRTTRTLDWIVDSLLTVGGVSLMSSDPKAGKSTLVRQLMREVLRGQTFLGRKCKQGIVHYFAIEEQLEVVNASFKRLGLTNDEQLYVHVGDPLAETKMEDFRDLLLEHRPALAVIDTLFDFLDVESENSYKEVKRELRRIRNIARETGTHILLVHHNSKGNKEDKRRGNRGILGSQAIAGGVDTIMVLEVEGTTRLITTSGREIKRWSNRELVFDSKDATYSLGPEVDEFS